MRRALELAAGGWGQTAPNPMVGAVVVRDGAIVGEGYHARFGEAHAEVMALHAAGERARGATLYVTLEPCNHEGKTPPCTHAIAAAGITRVVAAVRDPNPVASGGAAFLHARGIAVEFGDGEAEARELNAAFFHAVTRDDRPFVTLKLAMSLDAAIAHRGGSTTWITGPESRREVHRIRAGHDAIAVGIGTILADDARLTVRDWPAPRVPPARVVFDSSLRLPLASGLVRTAREIPVIVVARHANAARRAALEAQGVRVLEADGLADGLRALRAAGVRSLLLEGGARLAGSFLTASLVDRMIIFQAPVLLGPGALAAFAFAPSADPAHLQRLPVVERRVFGDDVMTTYALSAT